MPCVFVEESVAWQCGHLVRQNLDLVFVNKSFDLVLRRVVCVKNISRSVHLAGGVSLQLEPPDHGT